MCIGDARLRVNQRFLFPDELLDHGTSLPIADHRWWLVYTRSRQEKAIAEALLSQRVAHYLPLIKRSNVIRGRTKTALVPLFAGYLFVYGTDDDRLSVLKTNRVSTIQWVTDGDRLRADLVQISGLIAMDAPLSPEARIHAGDRVRVRSGRLRGLEGIAIRRQGKTRVLIAVNYLQQGASMEIDDFQLETL
jgi:transcriptional antiterminator RfaH